MKALTCNSSRTTLLQRCTLALSLLAVASLPSPLSAADRWNRPKESFVNWENPHVHPLDLTPDGSRLLAVNTADNSLLIFTVQGGTVVPGISIPVGLDPVSVRARTNSEAWVVNRISNDITVVDLNAGRVTAVLQTDVEPQDVIFAGTAQKAFVSCQKPNVIDVFNPLSLGTAKQSIFVNGKFPRAMAVSPDGSKVYAAFFQSGNGTTAVTGGKANPFEVDIVRRPEGPYGGVDVPPNRGTQFVPPLNPANPPPPPVSVIVRKNATGQWLDDNNGDWTRFVSGDLSTIGGPGGRVPGWDLPDRDVAVIDANTFAVTYQTQLMNILMAMAVKPNTGEVTVVGTDAMNQIRWEPNVDGIFTRVNFARFLPGGTNSINDLNPHLDYSVPNIPASQRALSIGDPRGIVWSSDGSQAWVTGMGSNNVVIISGSGTRLGLIPVGEGPTGIAYSAAQSRVYVLNKFAGSISVLDAKANTEVARVAYFDPTPAVIKTGRKFLYNTQLTSGLGQISCASCHVDARTDGLAWDLGNPAGTMTTMVGIDDTTRQLVTVQQHPMKGPLLTMTLQDDMNHPVMHWSGDRPELAHFQTAFVTLQGADAPLDTPSINAMEDFLDTIHIPPNPNRNLDNTYNTAVAIPGPDNTINRVGDANAGSQEFEQNCRTCHLGDTARTDLIRQGGEFGLILNRRPPMWRNFNERAGLWFQSADGSNSGFGYQQDGTFDSTHNQTRTDNMMAFMYSVNGRFPYTAPGLDETNQSRDTHAAVGTQVFFSSATVGSQDATFAQLISLAERGEIGLVAKAQVSGTMRGYAYIGDGIFQSDRRAEQVTVANVRALQNVLITAVPSGSEIRIGVDHDLDGLYDGDDSAPSSPLAVVRSTVNIAGHGFAQQSSDASPANVASAATDGTSGTIAQTASGDAAPWWQLTLDNTYAIDKIVLVNNPAALSRLRDITVYFYDASGNPIYRSHFLNRDNRQLDPTQVTLDLLPSTGLPLHAKTIKILRTPDTFGRAFDIPPITPDEADVLSLPEVQVFGATSASDAFQLGSIPRPLPGGSFEDVTETATFAYDPTGTPWTFTGQSGISGNGTGFTSGNPPAPEGTQVLFLQDQGSVSQVVNMSAGSYAISFLAAQRGNANSTQQSVVVSVDGVAIGTFTPPGAAYTSFQTSPFTLTAGPHTFTAAGLGKNPDGSQASDTTLLLDTFSISAVTVAGPPVISAITAQASLRGLAASLQVIAADPAGKALTFSATGLPTGLSISATSGLVSGTVSLAASSANSPVVTVNNGTLTTSATFSWTTTAPLAPIITVPAKQTTSIGAAASLQIVATAQNGLPLTFSASGLPTGLAINATGLISGTIATTAAPANTVTLTVQDSLVSTTATFSWATTGQVVTTQPLTGGDIGTLSPPGTDSYTSGVYTVAASGANVGATSDQFHFVSETFTGDGQITARVTSQTNTNAGAQAGVMFRETLNSNSRFTAMELTPWNGFQFQGRDVTGGGTGLATTNFNPPPNNWVRITRIANVFTGYVSVDGVNWSVVGVSTSPMASAVQVGIFVSSHDNTQVCTATFDNVQIVPLPLTSGTASGPPVISAIATQTSVRGLAASLQISASDPAGKALTFSATGLPSGLTINAANGLVSGTVSLTASSSNSPVVTANDGTLATSATFSWATTAPAPLAPVITVPPSQSTVIGTAASLQIVATDFNGLPLTFSATGLPAGLAINSTGLISGTVAATATPANTVSVTVRDSLVSTSATFSWAITTPAPLAPVITVPASQSTVISTAASLQIVATDLNGLPLTYSATGLPTGLAINPTGLISGTVATTAAPANTVSVTVRDSLVSTTATFSWATTAPAPLAPVITVPPSQSTVIGTAASLQIVATDLNGLPLTYSAAGLPAGLAINATGLISGTVATTAAPANNVSITVRDSLVSTTATFSWATNALAPLITVPASQSTTIGASASLQIVATDLNGLPLTYTATGLPAGLAINASGLISGTVAATATPANTVSITARDSLVSTTATFSWATTAAPAPVITVPTSQSTFIGTAASLQVVATGRNGLPLAFSATGLPAGLAINAATGLISGTVAATATPANTVSIIVRDSLSSTTATFSWATTAPLAPVITVPASQSTLIGAAASLQIVATARNGLPLAFSATGLPAGLAINAATGLISGTVAATATPANTVAITVRDSLSSATATFSWATAAPLAPVITVPPSQSTAISVAASLQIVATDLNGLPLTYSASGLPAGLAINASGLISGTIAATATPANTVSITARDSLISTTATFSWATTPKPTQPTQPLTGGDIGTPSLAGTDSYTSGVYTVTASGANVGNTSDQFHFMSETFTGNGQITARVTSQTNTNAGAQAGVMFRETLNPNSRFSAMELTPWNGFQFQGRDVTGGGTGLATTGFNPPPNNWVRITRVGNLFTGYVSVDGVNWSLVGLTTSPMASAIQIGIFVSSHDNTHVGTATFDNVQIISLP